MKSLCIILFSKKKENENWLKSEPKRKFENE